MVWLLRVLIIGLFSIAGERYFGQDQLRVEFAPRKGVAPARGRKPAAAGSRPAPKPVSRAPRPEPTYQPLSASGRDKYS